MEKMRINFAVTAHHDRHKAAQGMQAVDAFVPNLLLMQSIIFNCHARNTVTRQ